MNQKQLVIDTFEKLLAQGETTSLDVKLALRKEFPALFWTQEFVSAVLMDYQESHSTVKFKDNGVFRTYYSQDYPPITYQGMYEYITQSGVRLQASNVQDLIKHANAVGEFIHWSETKKKFYQISEIQENHLLNIIWKEMSEMSPQEVATFLQSSLYVKELISRYPI